MNDVLWLHAARVLAVMKEVTITKVTSMGKFLDVS